MSDNPDRETDKRHAEAIVEANIRVISAAYDKAMAYTNLIVLTGYAGFFGLWQLNKDQMTKPQMMWAALLMLVSIVVFVLFEVWKMYYSSRGLIGLARILTNPESSRAPERLLADLEAHNSAERRRTVWFGAIWHIVLVITVVTGLGAVGILTWVFIRGLVAEA